MPSELGVSARLFTGSPDSAHCDERLTERAQAHGIDVTADNLREVSYEFVLTERWRQRPPSRTPSTGGA